MQAPAGPSSARRGPAAGRPRSLFFRGIFWGESGSVGSPMPTKTPHPTRRRRSSSSRRKNTSARTRSTKSAPRSRTRTRSRSSAGTSARNSSRGTSSNSAALHLSLPRPPLPHEVVRAVREELDRLSERWKNLLPRLRVSVSGGNGADAASRARR